MSGWECLVQDKRRSPTLCSHEDITAINPVKKAEIAPYLNSLSTSIHTYFAFITLKSIKSCLIKITENSDKSGIKSISFFKHIQYPSEVILGVFNSICMQHLLWNMLLFYLKLLSEIFSFYMLQDQKLAAEIRLPFVRGIHSKQLNLQEARNSRVTKWKRSVLLDIGNSLLTVLQGFTVELQCLSSV